MAPLSAVVLPTRKGGAMARPMTIAEKILAAHAGLNEVEPGQLIECSIDMVLANDVTAPIAIREFRRIGVPHVFDSERIVLVPDHYTPNKDIKRASSTRFCPRKVYARRVI